MDWDKTSELMTEDVVWHNIPMAEVKGKTNVDAAIKGMSPDSVDWEVLSIAENGNKVLTERVER